MTRRTTNRSWTMDARGHFDNLIGGEWRPGAGYTANLNPSDRTDIVGSFAIAEARDAVEAVAAARAAVPTWSRSSIQERSDILERAAQEVLARCEEIGRVLAREEGKTLAEAIGETLRAGQILRFFAGEALRLGGEILPSVRPGVTVEITREALGVIGVITPWNFPIAIPAWKIAPALAYGNTIVFKPSSLVPGCAWILVDILLRAGLPQGVLNLVNGPAAIVGSALLAPGGVDAVSFTGSTETGATILREATASGKKCQLEMGGKNPLVVLADADLGKAVEIALQGAFGSTGQRCTASSRIIVEAPVHDRFVAALTERLESFTVGHALDPDTKMGPVADEKQLAGIQREIESARAEGARIAFGGDMEARPHEGHYLQPTLLTETSSQMRINREEVFGPVATVLPAHDYDEALAIANDTRFGLCAGIVTASLARSAHFKRSARAGMVMVNLPTAGVDYHVPFGGIKGSSFGPREQGSYAREFYTSVKTAYTNPDA